ncbi:Mitogen-activated protein kinase kinase kinase 10 [Phytophthora citrophthora]|uniref:Mitogen-activated protein kinase kinase kinase 10 n=1 Tax=Phytophthora citrophthora TaxID=4793 RepID=A0AAD9LG15_9STRA|nr:Mitogen-activated protein kinase kinase kinase 10 [Phytophthora citrophthora]
MHRFLGLLLGVSLSATSASTYSVTSYYAEAARKGSPYFVLVQESPECAVEMRAVGDDTDSTLVECSSDFIGSVQKQFNGSPFILQVQFDNDDCTKFTSGMAVPVSDKCEGSVEPSFTNSSFASLQHGSASIKWFAQPSCVEASWLRTDSADEKTLKAHLCDGNWRQWYSSSDARRLTVARDSSSDGNSPTVGSTPTSTTRAPTTTRPPTTTPTRAPTATTSTPATSTSSPSSSTSTPSTSTNAPSTSSSEASTSSGSGSNTTAGSGNTNTASSSLNDRGSNSGSVSSTQSSSGLSIGVIIGIAVGCVVLTACVLLVCCRRRQDKDSTQRQDTTTMPYTEVTSPKGKAISRGQTGLWDDDVITAKRISRDEVQIRDLISRGGFGEVYSGVFHNQPVAVKMLLPANRAEIKNVNEFLSEAKMAAVMDHPRITSLVGVAWNALSDLCVVFEYMDGGDLRTLLNKYERSGHPVGIDIQKATIAMHVCHALTYLHSLMPYVIHRDLKSRNVLLSRKMEAKLTDFGISRERLDTTMTAGVGTSLWMAPEVMMGERYDDKADIFSLGVVLSELDVHTVPYAQVKQTMSDAVLLHQIVMGKIHVAFSQYSPREFWELGHACTAVDPRDRPTAAEALYRLQMVLSNLESKHVGNARGSYVF